MDKSKLWCFEDFDLFENMSREEIESVEEHVFTKSLKRGERINFDKKYNKYVYLLSDGVLKVVATDDDDNHAIVSLIRKGNIFGALPLLGDFEVSEDYAEALEDAVVCFIDTEKLKQWMTDNHDLRTKIRGHIGERLRKVENRLLSMIFKDAKTRIHEFIVEFVKEFGTYNGDHYEVKNFLTNDEVAKLTATSRQTVNSILNELRDKNMIEYNKDILIVPDSSPLMKN
jgi:CRP/FNR family transcriptional regulator, cyclic AMP receptor protein